MLKRSQLGRALAFQESLDRAAAAQLSAGCASPSRRDKSDSDAQAAGSGDPALQRLRREQAAFEKWALTEYGAAQKDFSCYANGDYISDRISDAWKVWLARSAAPAHSDEASEDSAHVARLAMFVRQLCSKLNRGAPARELTAQAMDYLHQHGHANPLRGSESEGSTIKLMGCCALPVGGDHHPDCRFSQGDVDA